MYDNKIIVAGGCGADYAEFLETLTGMKYINSECVGRRPMLIFLYRKHRVNKEREPHARALGLQSPMVHFTNSNSNLKHTKENQQIWN